MLQESSISLCHLYTLVSGHRSRRLYFYLVVHSLVLLYQVVTLNVAANTQNNAILTLLVSNQFMEVKSSVFKKFDRENLFQLACADIVERIILLTFGMIIALRNWSQLEWSLTGELLDRVLVPFGMLVGSEVVVDVLKHAFVTKFNAISPNVYAIYSETLISDLVSKDGLDQSPMVARKLGFSSLPLCCLVKGRIKYRFNYSLLDLGLDFTRN